MGATVEKTVNVDNRVLSGVPDVLQTNQTVTVVGMISETLWTDTAAGFYVRVNTAGVITWATMAGAASAAPGAGAKPA